MNIGIISDTHDHKRHVRRAVEIFAERDVQYVLHAGDITTATTVEAFARQWKERFIAVFGNCDADRAALQAAVNHYGGRIEPCYAGEIDGKAIHMAHTPQTLAGAVGSQKYDLVIYGHTHRQDIQRQDRTLIVNPGAARSWMTSTGQVVILNLADMTYTTESLGRVL